MYNFEYNVGTNGSLVLEVDTSVEVNKHTPVLNARKSWQCGGRAYSPS